jgi:transcriptional regulator with XRE-family HTH domain
MSAAPRGRPATAAPPRDTFGYRLRTARLQLGADEGALVSQNAFAARVAERLGHKWHQTRLSHLEQGSGEPTLAELAACAEVAGVPIAWLAYGVDVATPTTDEIEGRRAWLLRYRVTQQAQAEAEVKADTAPSPSAPSAGPSRQSPGKPSAPRTRGRRAS